MRYPSLILASSSPKRKEILSSLGLKFKTYNPKIKEITSASTPTQLVKSNAFFKVKAVIHTHPQNFIIGADTIVSSGKKIFLKPRHWKEGLSMLQSYRNEPSYVYTGLTVYSPRGQILTRTQKSRFYLTSMPTSRQEKIFRMIYSPKQSGGFSIEGLGSIILDKIYGSYYNILGLPVYLLDSMFQELSYDLLQFKKKN